MKYVASFSFIGIATLFFSNPGIGQFQGMPPAQPEPAPIICAGSEACEGILKLCKAKCDGFMGAMRIACEKKKNCDKKSSYDYKSCMKSLGCYPAETSPSYTPPNQPGATPTACAGREACEGIIKLCKDKCGTFLGQARDACEKEKQCNETNYDFKSCMELVGCGPKEIHGGTPNYFLPNQRF